MAPAPNITLRRVSKLNITFLVDNTIEWMTQLPPGFAHELPSFLRTHAPPPDPLTGVPALDFDKFSCGAHGLSCLIETEDPAGMPHRTLFDAGPDAQAITRNLRALALNPRSINRLVLSHWHADHSGGVLAFLHARAEAGKGGVSEDDSACVVDVHPSRPLARGIKPPGHTRVLCRLPADPTFDEIGAAGGVVETHAVPHVVAGDTVYVSGEIPRVTGFEEGLIGGVRWKEDEGWVDEPDIMDERYVAVDVVGKGLVLLSACSHAGIVNVVKDAVRTFKRPIHMIIGGLHLAGPELRPRIEPTVAFLSRSLVPAPTYVLPMHCSGFGVKCALENALGAGCVPAGVGMRVVVQTTEAETALDVRLVGRYEGMEKDSENLQ